MKKHILIFLFTCLSFSAVLCAAPHKPIGDYLSPLEDSEAYKQYKLRPQSDFSKMLYLIDRFKESNFEVLYEGHYFGSVFAANFSRWFLSKNYKNEPLDEFIMSWCNRTFLKKELIWIKLPDGAFRLGREVLQEELKNLEAVLNPTPA